MKSDWRVNPVTAEPVTRATPVTNIQIINAADDSMDRWPGDRLPFDAPPDVPDEEAALDLQTVSLVTVVGSAFEFLHTWEEIVTYAAQLREQRDRLSWELGDLALYACTPNPTGGRPFKEASRDRTISAFAEAIGEDRSVVSAWMHNAEFWPPGVRAQLPLNVSWRQCAAARRRSGWRPGNEIAAEHRHRARTLLCAMADCSNFTGELPMLPVKFESEIVTWRGLAVIKVPDIDGLSVGDRVLVLKR